MTIGRILHRTAQNDNRAGEHSSPLRVGNNRRRVPQKHIKIGGRFVNRPYGWIDKPQFVIFRTEQIISARIQHTYKTDNPRGRETASGGFLPVYEKRNVGLVILVLFLHGNCRNTCCHGEHCKRRNTAGYGAAGLRNVRNRSIRGHC